LKPSNLLITREGRVKIADFGIGAIMADAQAHAGYDKSVSGTTVLLGSHTPLYVDHLSAVHPDPDPKGDIYALGIIAYQLLRGDITRPIVPAWRADLAAHDIPANVLEVISACVDIPARRFANGSALLAALDALPRHQRGEEQARHGMTLRFCRRCGRELIPQARFCNKCGTRIIGAHP
jgi:serine/threonine protein kinase